MKSVPVEEYVVQVPVVIWRKGGRRIERQTLDLSVDAISIEGAKETVRFVLERLVQREGG